MKEKSYKEFVSDQDSVRKELLATMLHNNTSVMGCHQDIGVARNTLTRFLCGKKTSFKTLTKYISWIKRNSKQNFWESEIR